MRIRNLLFFVLWLSLLSACGKNGETEEGNYVGPPLVATIISCNVVVSLWAESVWCKTNSYKKSGPKIRFFSSPTRNRTSI